MSFLSRIFRGQTPTTATAAPLLAELEAELRAVPARIAKARETLRRVADLTDKQHEDAEAELASAQRSETRLTAQIEELRAAHEWAALEEAAVALEARAVAAQQRVERDGPKLLAEYERLAEKMAKVAASLSEIDGETDGVNRAILANNRRAPESAQRPTILGVTERFLIEPDTVDPDRIVKEQEWGYYTADEKWHSRGVTLVQAGGEIVPTEQGLESRVVERVIPGRVRKGRRLPSPIYSLNLPAVRIGADAFWPRPR